MLASQRKPAASLPVLDWAGKARAETPPAAVLVELGLQDKEPRDWSGKATVTGAKVVHREGYRFRADDRLSDAQQAALIAVYGSMLRD